MLTNNTITELNRLNDYSTTKYGPFVDNCHAWGALRSEYLEVEEAAQRRDRTELRDELMDLANVATRWAEDLDEQPIGVPFDTNETPEQIEIRQLKQDAHYDHVAAAERIAELEREVAALRSPVDADMWKTPLEIECKSTTGDMIRVSSCVNEEVLIEHNRIGVADFWTPTDAARAARWLASYAAAHGAAV